MSFGLFWQNRTPWFTRWFTHLPGPSISSKVAVARRRQLLAAPQAERKGAGRPAEGKAKCVGLERGSCRSKKKETPRVVPPRDRSSV